jgi:serine protease Do
MPRFFTSDGPPPSSRIRRTAAALLLGTALVGLPAAGAYLVPWHDAAAETTAPVTVPAVPMMNAPATFSGIVKAVAPAVVNVAVTMSADVAMDQEEGQGPQQQMPQFPPGSPFGDMFKHFFEGPNGQGGQGMPESGPVHALGSGFIIDPSGYIVTNNHVIDHATEITVTVEDGTQYTATLVGHDAKTDLALLKIDAGHDLPYVSFGDSDTAEVGDWVVAVGNPFGLGGSVTSGIVSARGRNLQSGPFDDFLQIDAAINRGNSGGPTFNLEGQVIGINTAIFSPSGGSVGIGFAIPSNLAKDVIQQLRDTGMVARGWIGVQIQGVTPDMAEALGIQSTDGGAIVAGVMDGGPAAAAGLQQGDVILSFNGEKIEHLQSLPRVVAATKAGDTVPVEVLRGGEHETVQVTVGPMPDEEQVASADPGKPAMQSENDSVEQELGLAVAPLSPEVRKQFGIVEDVTGVLVTGVREDSPARDTGVGPGDIIVRIGSDEVHTVADVAKGIEQARTDQRNAVMLLVNRQGDERFVAVKLKDA